MGGIGGGGWWWVMVVLLLLLVLRSADLAAVDVVLEGLDAKNLLRQLCDAVPEGIRLSAAACRAQTACCQMCCTLHGARLNEH